MRGKDLFGFKNFTHDTSFIFLEEINNVPLFVNACFDQIKQGAYFILFGLLRKADSGVSNIRFAYGEDFYPLHYRIKLLVECFGIDIKAKICWCHFNKWATSESVQARDYLARTYIYDFSRFSNSFVFCSVGNNNIAVFQQHIIEFGIFAICDKWQFFRVYIQDWTEFDKHITIMYILIFA